MCFELAFYISWYLWFVPLLVLSLLINISNNIKAYSCFDSSANKQQENHFQGPCEGFGVWAKTCCLAHVVDQNPIHFSYRVMITIFSHWPNVTTFGDLITHQFIYVSTGFWEMSWTLFCIPETISLFSCCVMWTFWIHISSDIHFQAHPATSPHPQSSFFLFLTHSVRNLATSAQSSQHVKGYSCNRFPWLGLGPEA